MDPDIVFHAQLRDRWAHPVLAAAAVIVAAVVAIGLLPEHGGGEQSRLGVGATPAPSRSATPSLLPARSPSPLRADISTPIPERQEIEPGSYYLRLPAVIESPPISIRLMMPAGWASAAAGTAVFKSEDAWGYPDTNGPTLAVHAVTGVTADACRWGPDVRFEKIGPTVEDMTAALAILIGPERPGPNDVTLGGYPAKRFVLTDILDSCDGGPEGRLLWENATGSRFGFLQDATATIYVVDVDGDRLVIATHHRGSPAEDVEALNGIIASIDIEPLRSAGTR